MQELEAKIAANPDDEQLRIDYATALQFDSPVRSEFVLDQLWLRRHTRNPLDVEWLERNNRSRAVAYQFGKEWAPPILRDLPLIEFRGGFVEKIQIDTLLLLEQSDVIFASAPIRHLALTGAKGLTARLAGLSRLERVRSLDFSFNDLGDDDIAALCTSAYLEQLRWLALGGNRITRRGAEELARASRAGRLPLLQEVILRGNPFDPTDRFVLDHGLIIDVERTEAGEALEAKFERLPWLHLTVPKDGLPPASDWS
ncbi:MAG: hypothetical protein R2729_27205 [Bryobacteraceae bacterium]